MLTHSLTHCVPFSILCPFCSLLFPPRPLLPSACLLGVYIYIFFATTSFALFRNLVGAAERMQYKTNLLQLCQDDNSSSSSSSATDWKAVGEEREARGREHASIKQIKICVCVCVRCFGLSFCFASALLLLHFLAHCLCILCSCMCVCVFVGCGG